MSSKLSANSTTSFESFGDLIPYADPNWHQGYHSTYYKESHVAFRKEVREWVEDAIIPNVDDWEEAGAIDPALFKEAGERGYLAGACGLPDTPRSTPTRDRNLLIPKSGTHSMNSLSTMRFAVPAAVVSFGSCLVATLLDCLLCSPLVARP